MTEPEEEDGGGLGRGLARFGVRACPFVWVARARGRWRFVLLAAECLAAAAFGALLWRAVSLRNVPDVGEPPTAPAYGPPEAGSNAYALYAEAMSAYKWKLGPSGASRASLTPGRVRTAEPGVRALLEANREALDLFYQAADRPDAAPTKGLRTKSGATPEMSRLPDLAWLAVEDAAAAEAAGDLDAAWRGYRAVLRAGRHVARRGDLFDRQFGGTCRSWVLARLTRWAALPENTPKRLRQALDDVLALDAIAPDDEYTLRTIYGRTRSALDQPDGPFGAGRIEGY